MSETQHLRPLAEFPRGQRASVRAVLTDIDDTLTDHGRLPAAAYDAMERLRGAGLIVIPVTGRPAGWCDLIARQWPVDGVVGENGAFYFRHIDAERRMARVYAIDASTRAADRARLQVIKAEVLAEVPGAAVASDQAYREADLAIDFCEDVAPLPPEAIDKILAVFARRLLARRSSRSRSWHRSLQERSRSDSSTLPFRTSLPSAPPTFGQR